MELGGCPKRFLKTTTTEQQQQQQLRKLGSSKVPTNKWSPNSTQPNTEVTTEVPFHPGAVFLPWAKVGKKYIREVSVTHTWEVCMIFDTLPWSNVVPTRSYFTNKWINEKFKNWSMNSRSSHVLILWKFNIEVKPFTNPGSIIKRSCKVMDIWSPVDTEVSYKSWEVSCLKSALKWSNSELQWKEVRQSPKKFTS